MEVKDWITICSVVAVMGGWFVNGYLNRKNEIAKKRLDHRLPALKSFFEMWFFITKNSDPFKAPTFLPLVEKVRGEMHLYGKDDEILLFEAFIKSCERNDLKGANESLAKLVPLIRMRIRAELGINGGELEKVLNNERKN